MCWLVGLACCPPPSTATPSLTRGTRVLASAALTTDGTGLPGTPGQPATEHLTHTPPHHTSHTPLLTTPHTPSPSGVHWCALEEMSGNTPLVNCSRQRQTDTHKHRQTDGRTYIHTHRQTHIHTQTDRRTHIHTHRQTDGRTYIHTDRHTYTQTDRRTHKGTSECVSVPQFLSVPVLHQVLFSDLTGTHLTQGMGNNGPIVLPEGMGQDSTSDIRTCMLHTTPPHHTPTPHYTTPHPHHTTPTPHITHHTHTHTHT